MTETNMTDKKDYTYIGIVTLTSQVFGETFLVKYKTLVPTADGAITTLEKIAEDEPTLKKFLHDGNALNDIVEALDNSIPMTLTSAKTIDEYVSNANSHKLVPPNGRNETRSFIARYIISELSLMPHKTSEEMTIVKADPKYDLFHKVLADMDCTDREKDCGILHGYFIKIFGEKAFNYSLYQKYKENNVYKKNPEKTQKHIPYV